ncbi:hypothetical protein [Cystobacter fuscus]|uniref:hypothetical protein n=1 Tax=Cystobacter fuscus TaxID=43 RepID=UPI002B315B6B|nr:hypothetical protein F0U63_10185 [Cystobacter fuscus]
MNLLENPFHILGASPRDDRRRIVELAEERSLSVDPAVCAQARADLTHPRNRLVAEVAWLPGLEPVRVAELMERIQRTPSELTWVPGEHALAKANMLASALNGLGGARTSDSLHLGILELAALMDMFHAEKIRALINTERALSGFPEVLETSAVEEALAERRKHYRTAIKNALDELPPRALVGIVTLVVVQGTSFGTLNAPALIDDLVNTYEVEAQRFLDAEARNVELLVEAVRRGLEQKRPLPRIKSLLSRLEEVVTNWDGVAQPIQLSALSRGVDHDLSHRVASPVRSLAVDLFNQHGLIEESTYLTNLLQVAFREVPRVAEVTKTDAEALEEITQKRDAAKQEWERDISYETQVGMPFPQPFKMSSAGIEWNGIRWPLESITRVRWGGVTNGATGESTFTIAFGNEASFATIVTDNHVLSSAITKKLWRAVGNRLLLELITALGQGKRLSFGDAIVEDHGIEFTRHQYEGDRTRVRGAWGQIHVESSNGNLLLRHKQDYSAYAVLPYLSVDNTQVLDIAIRNLLETKFPVLMSDLLND